MLAQERWDGELEHTTRDGRTITEASRWSLRRDEHGAPASLLEINRDITFKKRAQEELRTLSERLRMATSTASIGVWDWDLRSNMAVWDDAMFKIFGIAKVVPMAYENFAQLVHPADLPKRKRLIGQGHQMEDAGFRGIPNHPAGRFCAACFFSGRRCAGQAWKRDPRGGNRGGHHRTQGDGGAD